MDPLLHLRLFEEPLGLPRVHLTLMFLKKVDDVAETYGWGVRLAAPHGGVGLVVCGATAWLLRVLEGLVV